MQGCDETGLVIEVLLELSACKVLLATEFAQKLRDRRDGLRGDDVLGDLDASSAIQDNHRRRATDLKGLVQSVVAIDGQGQIAIPCGEFFPQAGCVFCRGHQEDIARGREFFFQKDPADVQQIVQKGSRFGLVLDPKKHLKRFLRLGSVEQDRPVGVLEIDRIDHLTENGCRCDRRWRDPPCDLHLLRGACHLPLAPIDRFVCTGVGEFHRTGDSQELIGRCAGVIELWGKFDFPQELGLRIDPQNPAQGLRVDLLLDGDTLAADLLEPHGFKDLKDRIVAGETFGQIIR